MQSTSGVAIEALDAVRSGAVGVDGTITAWSTACCGATIASPRPLGPGRLAPDLFCMTRARRGLRACRETTPGSCHRGAAYVIDAFLIVALFTVTAGGGRFIADLVFGKELFDKGSIAWSITFVVWSFFYFFYCSGTAGKTPAGAARDPRGSPRRRPSRLPPTFVRTLVFPFSFLFFGLGFIGVFIGREHRALQDVAAGSTVVYDWDARAAHLRFLAKRAT